MQTFNPETTVEKRSKKKAGLAREREKDTFSMSESKVTNFYLRLEKKYVFYYLVYLRLYSFCNWDFGTIAWIAVSSETECRPFCDVENVLSIIIYYKFPRHGANIAAEIHLMCFLSWILFLPRSKKHIDKGQLCCYYALCLMIKIVI